MAFNGGLAINSLLIFHHLNHYESQGEMRRIWSRKSIVTQSAEDLLYFHLLIMTWSLLWTHLLLCLDWNELSLGACMLENGFIELPMTLKSHFPLKRHRNIVLFMCCNQNIKIWLLLSLEVCIHANTIISICPCVVPGFHWSTCLRVKSVGAQESHCFGNYFLYKKFYQKIPCSKKNQFGWSIFILKSTFFLHFRSLW